MHPLQDWPLWLIAVLLLSALSGAMHFGYLAGRRIYGRRARGASREGLGLIISSALALLGLLLGFTFGASQERFNVRRRLVAEEANVLQSTYMFVRTLDGPAQASLGPLLLQYGRARETFFEARNKRTAAEADALGDRLQDQIWARALDQTRSSAGYAVLDRVRQLFEVDGTRRAEHDARVPLGILQALGVFAIISAGVIGMALSGGRRHVIASMVFLFLLTTTATLILGLDRQVTPAMLRSQAPMERTLAVIQRWETARLAATGPPGPGGKP